MTAVDFLGPRGMGEPGSPRDVSRGAESPGEESQPGAIAAQAIEAQLSFGQIKPLRGRVAPRSKQHPLEKTWRTSIALHKSRGVPGKQKETLVRKKDDGMIQPSVQTAALPKEHLSVGLDAMVNPSAPKTVAFPVTRTNAHRTDCQPIDDEVQA